MKSLLWACCWDGLVEARLPAEQRQERTLTQKHELRIHQPTGGGATETEELSLLVCASLK